MKTKIWVLATVLADENALAMPAVLPTKLRGRVNDH
jgi:hypothetical protein